MSTQELIEVAEDALANSRQWTTGWESLVERLVDALKVSKAEALEEAAAWAKETSERLGIGSYAHGPSGRESDLSDKYGHASWWLESRAAEYRGEYEKRTQQRQDRPGRDETVNVGVDGGGHQIEAQIGAHGVTDESVSDG